MTGQRGHLLGVVAGGAGQFAQVVLVRVVVDAARSHLADALVSVAVAQQFGLVQVVPECPKF